VDAFLALLDARVAEAAEAWLTDPRDTAVYSRLVAAVEGRRRHLDRVGLRLRDAAVAPDDDARLRANEGAPRTTGVDGEQGVGVDGEDPGTGEADAPEGQRARVEGSDPVGSDSGDALQPAWPTVRSVGSDLVGEPAAVLRRLRGG